MEYCPAPAVSFLLPYRLSTKTPTGPAWEAYLACFRVLISFSCSMDISNDGKSSLFQSECQNTFGNSLKSLIYNIFYIFVVNLNCASNYACAANHGHGNPSL